MAELLTCYLGQLIPNGKLTLTGNQLGMLLWIQARGRKGPVRFHEEGIAGLISMETTGRHGGRPLKYQFREQDKLGGML